MVRHRPGRANGLGCPSGGSSPAVGVALVTFSEDEEILLLRHVFHTPNPWGCPAGGWAATKRRRPAGPRITRETGLAVFARPARSCGPCRVAAVHRDGL